VDSSLLAPGLVALRLAAFEQLGITAAVASIGRPAIIRAIRDIIFQPLFQLAPVANQLFAI
jgi:hypothetical protein